MKGFFESLKDGYFHVTEITDRTMLHKYRSEGIRIDDEGLYQYDFGDHKEYSLKVEPIGEDGQYQIALYKNDVLLTEKLLIWTKEHKD